GGVCLRPWARSDLVQGGVERGHSGRWLGGKCLVDGLLFGVERGGLHNRAVCTTVPAGPANVTWVIRPSCRLLFRQAWPLLRSATRGTSRATQQIRTWAGMRC